MSHAKKADKLLIKPAAGARPAPPRTRGQFIPKARTRRPVTRRVTRGTATTRLATAPDRSTRRVLPSPDEQRSHPQCRSSGLGRYFSLDAIADFKDRDVEGLDWLLGTIGT